MSESIIDIEKGKEILNGFKGQAEELLTQPEKVEELLQNLEVKAKELPVAGDALSRLPLMVSMIRAYIRKEYTVVSPKVIATMLGAVLYLFVGKDLISDKTPVLGYLDDIAMFVIAFMVNEKELADYAAWREEKDTEVVVEA
ncbi:MAG: DUF1232 domain-containing protein [Lachnospiraceae bacterium]|nr:DUF1232 domain-containing protein [Lachnospiraceae bacterium]